MRAFSPLGAPPRRWPREPARSRRGAARGDGLRTAAGQLREAGAAATSSPPPPPRARGALREGVVLARAGSWCGWPGHVKLFAFSVPNP